MKEPGDTVLSSLSAHSKLHFVTLGTMARRALLLLGLAALATSHAVSRNETSLLMNRNDLWQRQQTSDGAFFFFLIYNFRFPWCLRCTVCAKEVRIIWQMSKNQKTKTHWVVLLFCRGLWERGGWEPDPEPGWAATFHTALCWDTQKCHFITH